MLAGWLVQDHLTQGHLTWCPRLRNSWERECLVPGTWQVSPGSRAAESRMSGHGPSQQDCSTFAVRGIVQHLLCRVVRQRSPCETVRSTLAAWGVRQRSPRPRPCSVLAVEPVQGPLNAPDWLAGQHADRAWPTRRRGIRMPWWCWPVGRSPCCSPRQWPPGNESPCLIPRQR